MTLLTYAGKYVVQSTGTVQTTSTTLGDDTQASQTFTLYSTKTVLVIYNANTKHNDTNSVYGMKNAINVDGTDYSLMHQSAYAANYSFKNSCVWVGSLAAGSHTIKGRLACNNASTTCNLTNRTLIIYIFDGDEFTYLENATGFTTASTTMADDTYSSVTATPSGACKALAFYGTTNTPGTTERYTGKQIQLKIGGTARTTSVTRQSGYNTGGTNSDSLTTVFALSLTATSTNFIGQVAGNGVQTTTFSRRFMCVLFLADSTILDTDTDTTTVSSTSTSFADDTNMSITRTHEGELLVIEAASKKSATTSAIYGTGYGLMVDSVDVAVSRSSPSYSVDPTQALLAYAATVAAGSHTIKGRIATNTSTTSVSITDRIMVALWFPVKTPLTYKDKYVIQSGSSVSTTSSTLSDDTPATKTFSLTASQTVLVFYSANSDYGDTNNVAGFNNAISVDGTDYCRMYQSPYAADYPMRNVCMWVGTLASGSHTIKGRLASNTNSTTTTVTNRTLMIYIFDGDDYKFVENTTGLALAASESYTDDTGALISITPKANSKALVFYGVTNAPGTTEHYVGKKVCAYINGTDYTICETRQSSYSTGGTNSCSVTTAYGHPMTANTNYVFKGRVASVYTYATYVSRRFFAVLVFDDTTLLDIDSSATPQSMSGSTLTDDTDLGIDRTTLGELLVFYTATKTSFTTSDIQGNRYGIEIDGYDMVESRTSQAYSASANSCLVGFGMTVFNKAHNITGRYSSNESTGTVYITDRSMSAFWLARTVVDKAFSATHDIALSKAFSATCDILLSKTFASENDIIAQTLINKYFEATNDILLSKSFSASSDLDLSKPFSASLDIAIYKNFSSTFDVLMSKSFGSSNYIELYKNFIVTNDIDINSYFSTTSDVLLSKLFSSTDDISLYKSFSSSGDVSVSKSFSSLSDELLSRSMSASNDIQLFKDFTATHDIIALYVLYYASQNDINLTKTFSSSMDIALIKEFQNSSDLLYSKIFSASDDIDLIKDFSVTNDISVSKTFSSLSYIFLSKIFSSNSAILGEVIKLFYASHSILMETSLGEASHDINLSAPFSASNDVLLGGMAYQNFNDIKLDRIKSSRNDILLYKNFHTNSDIQVRRLYASNNRILVYSIKTSTNDIYILKLFGNTSDIGVERHTQSRNNIFLSSGFTVTSDIAVETSTESSNSIFLYKLFESTNDVLEFIRKFYESTNSIMLDKEFESLSDILVNSLFSSSHEIFRVIWDLRCPLTLVISTISRTVEISNQKRTVTINALPERDVVVGSIRRTVTINNQERSVTVTRCQLTN